MSETINKGSKKQGNQYISWFFTWNNYEEYDGVNLAIKLDSICDKYIFQEETGQNGTKHLQGSMHLKVRARLTELKKINPNIHWECTRNCSAADKYCCKEETRTGKIWKHEKVRAFTRTKSKFDTIKPREDILELIKDEPDHRTINWVWDEGSTGKTKTAAWMQKKIHGVCVANGKAADIKNHVINHLANDELDVLLITIPRSAEEYLGGLYGVIEEIKDGLIYSGKYEGGFANIEHPHVIVMCNFPPDYSKLTGDRWNVINKSKTEEANGYDL